MNLPRGCSINPSPPSDGFYQQPLEEIQKTLEAAVKPTVGQGPLAEVRNGGQECDRGSPVLRPAILSQPHISDLS